MLSKKLAVLFLAGAALASAQAVEGYRSDAAVQITGNFTKAVEDNGVRQTADDKAGVAATYRLYLHRLHGVEANYGYARTDLRYALGGTAARINSHANETTAAYVFRIPGRRVTPFALAGAGALLFTPVNGSTTAAQAEFVYGAGVDVDLSSRTFIRASYRGSVYKTPELGPAIVSGRSVVTHRAQPAVGFGFRF